MVKNGFVIKKVGSMTLGEKLKKMRDRGRLTLADVAKKTKIQLKYLEYLESGEYEKLPADVYVKGFLRSYAGVLGFSEKSLIKLYEREVNIKRNISRKNKDGSKSFFQKIRVPKFSITSQSIIIFVSIFIFLGMSMYLYRQVDNFVSNPRLTILNPENESIIMDNSVVISGLADSDAEVFINSQSIVVDENGKFSEQVSLQSGLNNIQIKTINRFGKEVVKILLIKSEYDNNNQNIPSINTDIENGLVGRFKVFPKQGDIQIDVEVDDALIFSGEIASGSEKEFDVKKKIKIISQNGKGVGISFNEKEIDELLQEDDFLGGVIFSNDGRRLNE